MHTDSKQILKAVITWFIINNAIALVVFSFVSVNSPTPLVRLFWITMIRTHIISSLTAITGYSLGMFFREKKFSAAIPATLAGTLCVSVTAALISLLVINIIFGIPLKQTPDSEFSRMLISIITISAVVTVITTVIERLRFAKAGIEEDLSRLRKTAEENRIKNHSLFSIKDGETHHQVMLDKIIYLSSHGKKTSFHTVENDYGTNQLLKEIEEKLPAEHFIRIHKQFIINIRYLSGIRYYEGGCYMAFLKDEDESRLPVGRKFVPLLKNRLGISP